MSEALKELLAKVEAGESPTIYGRSDPCGLGECRRHLKGAYSGSLDAAKALHEAVLPGWCWVFDAPALTLDRETFEEDGGFIFYVAVWSSSVRPLPRSASSVASRAWLIAILKALIAQQEDKT